MVVKSKSAQELRRELEADDGTYPETWKPLPGDILAGTLVRYEKVNSQSGPATVAVINDENSGRLFSVWLTPTVLRSEFDKMMFDNAAAKGAHCVDETRVVDIAFDGDQATGVTLQQAGSEPQPIASRVVVDATGQQSLIYVLLNARKHFRQRTGRRPPVVRLDVASSARWFEGWSKSAVRGPPVAAGDREVAEAHTWLLSAGWRRYGRIDPAGVPGS